MGYWDIGILVVGSWLLVIEYWDIVLILGYCILGYWDIGILGYCVDIEINAHYPTIPITNNQEPRTGVARKRLTKMS